MNSSVSLSNFEKTGTTFTDGVLRGVLRRPDNRSKHSSRLDLGDQLLGGSSADRIRYRIERRKIRNRGVVVGCDHLIRADSLRLIHLPLQNPRDHSRPAVLRSEYRRTPDISYERLRP